VLGHCEGGGLLDLGGCVGVAGVAMLGAVVG
jgi:hypothetical protein